MASVVRQSSRRIAAPGRDATVKLLVVDDDPAVVLSLTTFFPRQALEVEGWERDRAALEILERRSFDMVLLDLLLPGVSGMQLLCQISENHPEVGLS